MTPRQGLVRSLAAALALGVAFPFYCLTLGWLVPASPLVGLYWVGAVAAYAAVIAPSAPRALGAGMLAAGLGGVAYALVDSRSMLAAALALVLAVTRSGYLARGPRARTLVVEGGLLVASLAFAATLASIKTIVGLALATWGFFLVQSCYLVVAGWRNVGPAPGAIDGFDQATARAAALLDEV